MKKILLLFLFLGVFVASSQAQIKDKLSFGISGSLMYPQPFFERHAQTGLALGLIGAYRITDKISLGLEYNRGRTTGLYDTGSSIIIHNNRFNVFMPRIWYKFNILGFNPYASLGYGYTVIQELEDESDDVLGIRTNRTSFGEIGVAYKRFNVFTNVNFHDDNGSSTSGFSGFLEQLFIYYYGIGVGYTYNF